MSFTIVHIFLQQHKSLCIRAWAFSNHKDDESVFVRNIVLDTVLKHFWKVALV